MLNYLHHDYFLTYIYKPPIVITLLDYSYTRKIFLQGSCSKHMLPLFTLTTKNAFFNL